MFDIKKYLEKFKVLSNSRFFLRAAVKEAIKEVCNVEISPEKIDIKNGIARINEKGIIKTEIFLKKTKIIEYLNKKTENKIKEIL